MRGKKTKQSTGLNHSQGRFRLPFQTFILFFDTLLPGTLYQCTLPLCSNSSILGEAHWIRLTPLQRGMGAVCLILRLPEHWASWNSWVYSKNLPTIPPPYCEAPLTPINRALEVVSKVTAAILIFKKCFCFIFYSFIMSSDSLLFLLPGLIYYLNQVLFIESIIFLTI